MKSTLLEKPNGIQIEVNQNSLAYAKSLGWVEVGEKPKRKRKKVDKDNG